MKRSIDVVLMDIQLPEMDGMKLLEESEKARKAQKSTSPS
jgi:CheY-like chemotaxis protein